MLFSFLFDYEFHLQIENAFVFDIAKFVNVFIFMKMDLGKGNGIQNFGNREIELGLIFCYVMCFFTTNDFHEKKIVRTKSTRP